MKKLPQQIRLVFTEEDVAKAKRYDDHHDCLLATALQRLGFQDVSIGGGGWATIQNQEYRQLTSFGANYATRESYVSEVVGMEVILEKAIP